MKKITDRWHRKKKNGFSLVEILVVIAIIGVIASIILVNLSSATGKARDAKRKTELAQIGRMLSGSSCYMPDGGSGDYDTATLVPELAAKNPQYAQYASLAPKDPKSGTATQSFYHYIIDSSGAKCALYANLENPVEPITLSGISAPTPGGGKGVFQAVSAGWNGTDKYFQVSN
jgi:prepilin-type N-terminal cleavage/methylation domain-containing protein